MYPVTIKLNQATDKAPHGYYKIRLMCKMCRDGGMYAMKYGTTISEAPCPKCATKSLTIHIPM